MPRDYSDLSKEQLIALLERRDRERRLGLVWEREAIERDRAVNTDFVTLDEIPDLSRPGPAGARNLVIEGDNYDALRALRMTHKGKVKCIYIDPPYNTGAKDWVYNDRYVAKEDRYRHSLWLEFMHQRLTLARDLLREDGVLLISIGQSEVSRLGVLLEDIFSEENELGTIIWKNATDNNPTHISEEHEYIFVIAKDRNKLKNEWKSNNSKSRDLILEMGEQILMRSSSLSEAQKLYADWHKENKDQLWPLERYSLIDETGPYTRNQSVHNPGREGYRYDVLHPVTGKPCKQPLMGYRFPPETMDRLIKEERVIFGENENKIIELKLYAHEFRKKLHSVINIDGRLGSYDLKSLFGKNAKVFNFPKPVELLKELLSFTSQPNDLILDFFAGSGTTAHAAMALDQEEGVAPEEGRRWIMVSSTEATADEPEKNLARDVLRERIVRAADKLGRAPDFAYLRCRRTAQEDIAYDVDGPDVWRLIQLRHDLPLAPFDPGAAVHQAIGRERVVYLDVVSAETAEVVEAALSEEAGARPVHVYSWTAGLLRERFEGRATLLQLPGALEAGFWT